MRRAPAVSERFPTSLDEFPPRSGGAGLAERGEKALQPSRVGETVDVDGGDAIAPGGAYARVPRLGETGVAVKVDHAHREPGGDFPGAVSGAVVYHDDFGGGDGLVEERMDAALQESLGVVAGDVDGGGVRCGAHRSAPLVQ